MKTTQAHLFIEGRVQGVFYRAFTRDVATRLGLKGWVRNLYDGRVEALFRGSRDVIDQAIEELRKGPRGSSVTGIEVEWEEATETGTGFEIRY